MSKEEELSSAPSSSSPSSGLSAVRRATANALLQVSETRSTSGDFGSKMTMEPKELGEDCCLVEDVLALISAAVSDDGSSLSDGSSLLAIVCHAISAYMTTLEAPIVAKLAVRLCNETDVWISSLFNVMSTAKVVHRVHCHDEVDEGVLNVVRLALHKHFEHFATRGFEAVKERKLVIYYSSTTQHQALIRVSLQLGLNIDALKLIEESDLKTLAQIIDDDLAKGETPFFALINVNSGVMRSRGPVELLSLMRRHQIWLHLEGHALTALTIVNSNQIDVCDSMSLSLDTWLAVRALPCVTLYKEELRDEEKEGGQPPPPPPLTPSPPSSLKCLPLWAALKQLGRAEIKLRIANTFKLLEKLNERLRELDNLKIVNPQVGAKTMSVEALGAKKLDLSQLFNTVDPALSFQYVNSNLTHEANKENDDESGSRVSDYCNNLNSWLGQTMQRDNAQLPLEIVDVATTGYVLRLCPFESFFFSGSAVDDDDVNAFVEGLSDKLSILDTTVSKRETFKTLIEREASLEHVDINNWAGLGGVRYIPSELIAQKEEDQSLEPEKIRGNLEALMEERRDLIDHRNIELVQQLKATDSAFSLGEAPDGKICIRFGMVSPETSVDELLTLVVKSGKALDERVTQLANMAEVIRKGIEQAQGELQRENDDALWQEGILRHVPLVGSFVNWFAPQEKPQVKGRCLSLDEGKLESTEKIYQKPSKSPEPVTNGSLKEEAGEEVLDKEAKTTKDEVQIEQQPVQEANEVKAI